MSADEHPRRGRRALSREERALWRGVARSVKPLRRRAPHDLDDEPDVAAPPAPPAKAAPQSKTKTKVVPSAHAHPVRTPGPPPLTALARRETQKLVRGRADIDARLDLHGMTQAQAHAALAQFLRRAQHDGARFVLIITGKGARFTDSPAERGILRRQVPLWLGLPEFRSAVIGFEEAHVTHGGAGALYVRLRRVR